MAASVHKSGRIFLVDAFQGKRELADSVNHLPVVGFYLINIGYATSALRTYEPVRSTRRAIKIVSEKIGVVLLVLGAMHFFNIYVFTRLRKRAQA